MAIVQLFSRRREQRQARRLARLLVALDDANRSRRTAVAPARRGSRVSLSAR